MVMPNRKKGVGFSRSANIRRHNSSHMGIKDFWRSLQNLDMENYGSWPLTVKLFVIVLMLIIIAGLAYAWPINNKLKEIKASEARQETLLDAYREKESRARQLEGYKKLVQTMEFEFSELLDKLPKDNRVSELVMGINTTGVNSDLQFKDISIEPQVNQELFIEQPIRIEAIGEYHQFGNFISGLASLPRIITMHDFEVKNSKPSLDNPPELTMILNTKTYRSKDEVETQKKPTDDTVVGVN